MTDFACRTTAMTNPIIQDILKVANKPGIISLAGGLPAPESFPMDIIDQLTKKVLLKYRGSAFQYGPTQGMMELREALVIHLSARPIDTDASHILVANGSQSILDLLGRIFIEKGVVVGIEKPTYLGALQAFTPYEPTYVEMDTDKEGITLESFKQVTINSKPRIIYLNPTFQNPTGKTLSLKRRIELGKLIRELNVLVIEDDPYGNLLYSGKAVQPLWKFAPDNVIYVSTFSKILAPGIRIGYCVAPLDITTMLVAAKQGSDLHTNSFSQALAAEYLLGGYLEKQLPKIIEIYKPRLETMLSSLKRHMPKGYVWTEPNGGMFVWVTGPKEFNSLELYDKAIAAGVAFVPGFCFFAGKGEGSNTMRLNFTNVSEDKIENGIKILSSLL